MRQKYDAWLSQQAPEEMFFFRKSQLYAWATNAHSLGAHCP